MNDHPRAGSRRGERCHAIYQDGELCICFRWRGHDGPHRGAQKGWFYRGARFEWTDDPDSRLFRSEKVSR